MIRIVSSKLCLILLVSKYLLTTGALDSSILIPSMEESASHTKDRLSNQIKLIRGGEMASSSSDTFAKKSYSEIQRILQEERQQEKAAPVPTRAPQTKGKDPRNQSSTPKGTTTRKNDPVKATSPQGKMSNPTTKGPSHKGKSSSQKTNEPNHKNKNLNQPGQDSNQPLKSPQNLAPYSTPTSAPIDTLVRTSNSNKKMTTPTSNSIITLTSPPSKAPITSTSQSTPMPPVFRDLPSKCVDSSMRFKVTYEGNDIARFCAWVARKDTDERCAIPGIDRTCPLTCGTCSLCADSPLRLKFNLDGLLVARSCEFTARRLTDVRCAITGMSDTCRETCGSCT